MKKIEDKAAEYLEEMGISGDKTIQIEYGIGTPGGAYNLHDLMAHFFSQESIQVQEEIKDMLECLSGLLAVIDEALKYVPPLQWGDPDATDYLISEARMAKMRYFEKYVLTPQDDIFTD